VTKGYFVDSCNNHVQRVFPTGENTLASNTHNVTCDVFSPLGRTRSPHSHTIITVATCLVARHALQDPNSKSVAARGVEGNARDDLAGVSILMNVLVPFW
jgi:hypothetical protein